MRINFIGVRGVSGGVKVCGIHADRLRRRGHDVTMINVPNPSPPLRSRIKSFLLGRGWPRRSRFSHLDQFPVRQNSLPEWRPIEDGDVPDGDVVIATWWETAEWVARLSPSKGAKVYFVQGHETFVEQSIDRVRATYRLPLHKIVISRWLADLMRDAYGDPNVTLASNSVDTAQFHAPPRGKQPRPTVGLIYATPPVKDIEVGLRAIESVRRECPELRVVAFGMRPPPPELASRPDVTYVRLPDQDRIRDLYAMCDVWLLCSKSEGFGLAVIEAMACRCPVVSTRCGGPQELVRDGVNGFLVDVGDAEGLARRLLDALRLPEDRWRAMSDAANDTATRYSWDDASDRFFEGLRTAIERRADLERVRP